MPVSFARRSSIPESMFDFFPDFVVGYVFSDYASTKASMMYSLVPTLKNEIVDLAPRGRVNAVSPG